MSSRCPKCELNQFEIVVEDVNKGSGTTKIRLVRCSKCKTVVGALEKENVADLIDKLAKALNLKV